YRNFSFGVGTDTVKLTQLHRDGMAQLRQSIEPGITVNPLINGDFRAAAHGRRHTSVAYALGEDDTAKLLALKRHHPDFRLGNPLGALTQPYRHLTSWPVRAWKRTHGSVPWCNPLLRRW